MHPEEAVRQLEYAIDASLDETGQRTAAGYRPTFERVADHADGVPYTRSPANWPTRSSG